MNVERDDKMTPALAEARAHWADANPYALASAAGCSSPDAVDSPGARWLAGILDDALEVLEHQRDTLTVPGDLGDLVSELADTAVPIYTHERMRVYVDLEAYRPDVADVTEVGITEVDPVEVAGVALYLVAQGLLTFILEDFSTAALEDEAAEQ